MQVVNLEWRKVDIVPTTETRGVQTRRKRRLRLDHETTGRRGRQPASHTSAPRPKPERRRHIDPTTCERDYSDDEILFMRAMDDYKRKSGRMFPTWSEVLEVLHSLGYRRTAEPAELPAFKMR